MNSMIYTILVSIGRQDLANTYKLIESTKTTEEERLELVEEAINSIQEILQSNESSSKKIESIYSEVKDL